LKRFIEKVDIFLLLASLLPPVFICLAFDISLENYHLPFTYESDGLLILSLIKTTLQNGWYLNNPFLGSPFLQQHFDFPLPEGFLLLIIKFLGLLSKDPFTVLNLFYLSSYSLVGGVSYLVLRRLSLNPLMGLAGGITFALLPYHQMRLTHLFLSNYYSVPIFVYLAFTCFSVKMDWTKKLLFTLCLLTVIASSGGLYYSFFGALYILASGLLSYSVNKTFRGLKLASILSTLIFATVLLNASPNILWRLQHGKNAEVATRSIVDTEFYGLKIAQLLLPMRGHRFGPFANGNLRYSSAMPLVNENETSSLGIIGALGFIALTLSCFFSATSGSISIWASRLNLLSILYATVGGFAVLFSIAISPQIRALNRISVFIGFLSIYYFFYLLQKPYDKLQLVGWTRFLGSLTLSLIVVSFAYWDQVSPQHRPSGLKDTQLFDGNQKYFTNLESDLPTNSKIHQLPYIPYPENPVLHMEGSYGLLIPYLHTHHTKWSYGAMRGTKADAWLRILDTYTLADQIRALTKHDVIGILVDRRGYKDSGNAIEAQFQDLKIEPASVSPDGTYVFYRIDKSIIVGEVKNFERALPVFTKGWPNLDHKASDDWKWSRQKSEINLITNSSRSMECTVELSLQADEALDVAIRLASTKEPVAVYHLKAGTELPISFRVTIPPDGMTLNLMAIRPPGAAPMPLADRYFGLKNIRINSPQ
jgi:phosphoglycerol transferase